MRSRLTHIVLATVVALAWVVSGSAQDTSEWVRPFPAFRLIGNIYWVGTYDLSTYLVTTPQGHILINTGLADTVPEIRKGVEQLGFRMSDVKILTATHGHYDHVAGMAALKRMTGARVLVNERDRPLLETGGKADFRFGNTPGALFDAVTVDGTFKDGESISLGGTTLVAHLHAGHTKGATTFTTTVVENGKSYRVAIANMGSINPGVKMTGMPGYPDIAQDYARTFLAQKDLPVDVFFASHASQFRMHDKYKPGDPYNADRFVDPKGYLAEVQRLEKAYLDQVARERAPR
ncbi:MAG: subclass B3 metallo-beta-lactamase [Acidobacteria bacterium]|nr:subclass B3 metallo-beta-lactamase [Acidobacteriota bacterium]